MPPLKYPKDVVDRIGVLHAEHKGQRQFWEKVAEQISEEFDIPLTAGKASMAYANHFARGNQGGNRKAPRKDEPEAVKWRETRHRDEWVIEYTDSRIRTPEDACRKAGVDLDIWEIERVVVGGHDVTMKIRTPGEQDRPFRSQNQLIKVYLKRKVPKPIEDAVEHLLDRLRKKSPVVKLKRRSRKQTDHRRALEVCLFDIHHALRCFKPGADADWSPEISTRMVIDVLSELLELSKPYRPFEQVFLAMGNDYFHTDSIWQTTTAGTGQPEADAYYHSFVSGEVLAITIIDILAQLAPVWVYSIPGNHDRTTSFMLGRILRAYYHRDKNVTVEANEAPYKFHRYGCNLIGYEHGHSIKPIRLAALMANECPEDWLATKHGYRVWRLADQHRYGASKPSMHEEQGVACEYMPSIVVPNEWHKLKSFNWQQRGSMAHIWDYSAGPIARLQVNVDRYLNCLMGKK